MFQPIGSDSTFIEQATMAGKRKRRSSGRMRRGTKRLRRTTTLSVRTLPALMPDNLRVPLYYTQRNVVNVAAGVIFKQVFAGNNVFDPDYTGGGSQPTGFDQYAALYKAYFVRASAIKLKTIGVVNSAGAVCEFVICPTVNATDYAATDPSVMWANPLSKFTLTRGVEPAALTHYMTTNRMAGTDTSNDDTWQSQVTTVPAAQFFWHITLQTTDESTTQALVLYTRIIYYTEFRQRQPLILS